MTVWSHRDAGTVVATSNVTLMTVPTGRTAVLSRLELDVDVAAATVLRVSLVTPGGVSLRKFEVTGPAAGVQTVPSLERLVLVAGDIVRLTAGVGITVDWWLSYLLLVGDPS